MTSEQVKEKLVETAFRLVVARGWTGLTMAALASDSGLSLAQVYAVCPRKLDILLILSEKIDHTVLAAGLTDELAEPPRDRLFDVLMRRFDALKPYQAGLIVIARDLRRHPVTVLATCAGLRRSMAWMLIAAGLDAQSSKGCILSASLLPIYLTVLKEWFDDKSVDQAATMAALDRRLRQLERFVSILPGGWPEPPISRASGDAGHPAEDLGASPS